MAGPSWNHPHESVNELIAPANRGSVDAHPTFGSSIRGLSIIPSGPFMPNIASVNFVSEPASLMPLSTALSFPSTSSGPPFSSPYSLVSHVIGTFAEVTGPFFAYTRADCCEVYPLTTGNMDCFRDPTSPFKWFGFRNCGRQVEFVDSNFQFSPTSAGTYAKEIMALRKTLFDALYTNYSDRHTTVSINAALNRNQSKINRHLFSDALTLSTVHIIYDFTFLERHLRDGKEIDVKVVVTIEFYQAPWRTGTRRWNCGGSLDHMSTNWEKTDFKVQHNFEETDPISDSHSEQPHVDPASSGHAPHQPTASPAAAAMNPDALMTYSAQTTAITSGPLNVASQDSQALSSLVSGFDLDADNISMTCRAMASFNKDSIDLSQRTPSGTDSLLKLGLSDNITSSPFQGLLGMQQGSSASSSFRQVAQPSFVSDGSLAADMWVLLPQPSVASAHPMIDDPISNSGVVNNNGDSLCVVVSNFQDGDALVVNLDAHQPTTNPRPAIPAYPRPVRMASSEPTSATNPHLVRTVNSTTRTANSRQTRSANPRSSTLTNPTPTGATLTGATPASATESVRSFPCRYIVCTHKPFATKWSMETHANTHDGLRFRCPDCELDFARPGDRIRHRQIEHLGYLYRCDYCLTERTRKPTDSQLDGCDNNGRKHRYQQHIPSSTPSSVSVTFDAP